MNISKSLKWIALAVALLGPLIPFHAAAQIQVSVSIPRRLYIAYEPVVATVSVTNLSGRPLNLEDHAGQPWFTFQINGGDERLIGPRNPDYRLEPMVVPAGMTIRRSANLTELYPITDFGVYRIKAVIYVKDLDKYFLSKADGIEISEGKTVWQQTVGVPEGTPGAGENRVFSLLTFRLPKENMLYVRVEDRENGSVYATMPLARVLTVSEPEAVLDADNQLHVLQLVGPKTFVYSRIGVNGELLSRKTFAETKSRPKLKRSSGGGVTVAGGQVEVAPEPGAAPPPKLSDRPVDMPTF